jgi:14-3-3 protein epsilon
MEAVLNGGPWTFDNNMLILERVQLGMQIEQIPLTHVNMWVQVHDLPMGFMKEQVGTKLANYIGNFLEYDKNNNSSFWRQYMRIRVKIDVRSPLKRDAKVMNREGKWCTVKFRYEKLGTFCFVCGVMGHAENKCEIRFSMEQDDGTRGWSSEIRADSKRQGGRFVSRWLKEEGGDRTNHGGSTAGQARGQGESSRRGFTDDDVAPGNNSNLNRPNNNQSVIIARQENSLAVNERQAPQDIQTTPHINPPIHNTSVQPLTSQITTFPSFIPSTTPFLNSSIHSMPAEPIITPFTNINSPIILTQPETETHKTQSFTHQLLTFTSQALTRDPPSLTHKPSRQSRAYTKATHINRPSPTHTPDPISTQPRPEKKPKFVLVPNPTQDVPVPVKTLENMEDMESQTEKKRRREDDKSVNNEKSQMMEHFLTAGPGSQACRDQ